IRGSDPFLASVAIHMDLTPDFLARTLKRYLTYPELRLAPATPSKPLEQVSSELQAEFAKFAGAWNGIAPNLDSLVKYFVGGKKWATGKHAKQASIEEEIARVGGRLVPATVSTRTWEAIEFFSLTAIREETGTNKQIPEPYPPVIGYAETLVTLASEHALAHRLSFLKTAGKTLADRKQQSKQQSFDDLVSRLAATLDGPSGRALAESAQRKYRVALIDESQDTDPLQWKIFQRIFARSPDRALYLIGDPKQAIYGFRGADVHTYLRAAATAQHEYSLNTNWRSEA